MYGLNLPIFLGYLDITWRLSIQERAEEYDDEGKAESYLKSLRAQKLIGVLVSYLEEFKPVFKRIRRAKKHNY